MEELTALGSVVPLYPRVLAVIETCKGVIYHFKGLGFLTNSNNLTRLYLERCNAYYIAINGDVLVTYKLTSCTTCGSDSETEHHIVETAFEELKKNLTCYAVSLSGLFEHITELTLKYAVCVLGFLLLRQHDTILRGLATTVVAMLSRSEVSLGQNFFFTEDGFTKTTVDS